MRKAYKYRTIIKNMAIKAQKDKPIKLDTVDKKIFYYLSVNYRIQRKKLAKLVRISPQRLNHRIKQLEKQFLEPYVCLNYPLLNIKSYLILFKSLTETEINTFSDSKNIYYFLRLVGDYQYLAIVFAENIISFCSEHIPNYIPEVFSLEGFFPDKWNGFDVSVLKETPKSHRKYELNSKDYEILSALAEKPNASLLDLSTKLHISRQTLNKRIKLMEEVDIIQAYRFALNVPKIGLLTYFIHLSCKPSEIENIKDSIRNSKYSGFLFQSNNHLFFPYIVFNPEQLFNFLEEIEQKTGSIIDVSQNTGNYVVEPVPKYVRELLRDEQLPIKRFA